MHTLLIVTLLVAIGPYTQARRIAQNTVSEGEPLLDILSMLESGNNTLPIKSNSTRISTAKAHSHGHSPDSPVDHSRTFHSLTTAKELGAKGHLNEGVSEGASNDDVKGVIQPASSLTGSDLLSLNSRDGLLTLLTQGRSAVSDLQTSVAFLDAARRLKERAAAVRHEVELDVLALNATVQQEYDNVSRLRFFEQEQDKVLRAQLSYLAPAATPQPLHKELELDAPSELLLQQAEPSHREKFIIGSGSALAFPSVFNSAIVSLLLFVVVWHPCF